jgi:hypothetical protein
MHTWRVIKRLTDANVIPSGYLLRRKRDVEGNTARYNTRVVAMGFRQNHILTMILTKPEALEPVLKACEEWLVVGAYKNVVIYQANTKNAYLNPYPRKCGVAASISPTS